MNEEIAQAFIPHIPTIVASFVGLIVSIISLCVVLVVSRRERIKKDFEREYDEPLKFTHEELAQFGLDGFKIIAPKGKRVIELTDCEFVKTKETK